MAGKSKTVLKVTKSVFMLLLVLSMSVVVSVLVMSIAFSSVPLINNDLVTYTRDDLVCEWIPSADVISANVSWYNGSTLMWNGTVSGNSSVMDDAFTTKNDNWICEVALDNGTDVVFANASMSINNTAPDLPSMKNSTGVLSAFYQLTEDVIYTFYIYSGDDDNDTLTYDLTDSNIFDLCNIEDAGATGRITCNASHRVIKNSELLGSETSKNHTVRMYSNEAGTSGYTAYADYTFSLIPVNDQPFKNNTVTLQSAKVGFNWSMVINQVFDEELNYPVNFSVSAALNDDEQNTSLALTITSLTENTANLTFTVPVVNSQYGLWNVTVNMTDLFGSNSSRPAGYFMFNLQINSSNFNPEFTTNFTNLSEQNWTQGDSLLIWLEGNDTNIEDLVRFNITRPTDINLRCNITPNPWAGKITLVNQSPFNASAFIEVTNLTNDFVACRYVDFTIYDLDDTFKLLGGRQNISNFLINIINVNDPPVLYEKSISGNMSNLSVKKFQRLSYFINASDIDALTYDVANTGTLYYFTDNELFPVNMNSGEITIFPDNDSFIGNWSFNVTVSDGEYNVTRQMNIEIIDNMVPVLNLSDNHLVFWQNENISINFSVIEFENETMNLTYDSLSSFSNETYISSFNMSANNYSDGNNNEFWILNMTRELAIWRNSLVGQHLINIIFSDSYGAYQDNVSTGLLNFTIMNENDAPFFDSNNDNISDNIIFDFVVYNYPFTSMINVTDLDLFVGEWANETLNFSFANPSAGIENITLTLVPNSSNSFIINFTGRSEGIKTIDIIATDSFGENVTQTVTFDVLAPTNIPRFHSVKPYFNNTLNMTISEFVNTSIFAGNVSLINASENDTLIFDAIVTNDSVSGNYLTYFWYVDGVLNMTRENVTPSVDSSFSKYFNFFTSNMTHNVTLVARDVRYSESNWTWVVNLSNLNRPPVYCPGRLQDLMVNGTTIISNYMSGDGYGDQRFYDPDNDILNSGEGTELTCDEYLVSNLSSLNFSVFYTYPCEIIDFSFDYSDLTLVPTLMGLCQVQFNATDEYNVSVLSSDVVDIIVIGAEPSQGEESPSSNGGTQVRTQTVTVPLEEEVDKPKPISIIAPASITTYANKTLYIPFKIKNTWTTDVEGIDLSSIGVNASLNNESNITLEFSNTYWDIIHVGEEKNVTLAISNYRTEGPFEVIITANVNEPEFNDTATVLISTLEQMSRGDVVKAKITFAKDLLSENPVCRELNDLLDRAETEANVENYEDAIKLVDGVINGCKYLMKEEELRTETPGIIKRGFDSARKYTIEIVAGAGLLLILTLLFYAIAALKKKISED